MGGRLDFDLGFGVRGGAGRSTRGARRSDGDPFRLLLVGDFSGRGAGDASRTQTPLRRPLAIDAGDVDLALGRFEVGLPVAVPGAAPELARFTSLDDFHPDALYGRLAAFQTPRQLRATLVSPSPGPDAFAAVEAWLQGLVAPAPAPAPAGSVGAAPGPSPESTDSTLERLLGRAPAPSPPSTARGVVDDLLADIVRPHVTPDVGARRAALLAALDEVLTRQMRGLLTAPSFRALEGVWRGVDRVARSLDTDAELSIALLDADHAALAAALPAPGGELEASALHQLLVADEPRGWSVIAVETAFDRTREDLSLLAALGALASRAGAALLADLRSPTSTGEEGDPAFWQALRESPLADRIALGLPRVLARLPYGKKADPISSFPFEELPPRAGADPTHRLWGSAAFAMAQGLGSAFRADAWDLDPATPFDLDDLPTHTYDDDGEPRLVPTTELALTERTATPLRSQGLTPLLPRLDRGSAHCPGISSLSTSPAALSGPWSQEPEWT